jgi:hypothetical protein
MKKFYTIVLSIGAGFLIIGSLINDPVRTRHYLNFAEITYFLFRHLLTMVAFHIDSLLLQNKFYDRKNISVYSKSGISQSHLYWGFI